MLNTLELSVKNFNLTSIQGTRGAEVRLKVSANFLYAHDEWGLNWISRADDDFSILLNLPS